MTDPTTSSTVPEPVSAEPAPPVPHYHAWIRSGRVYHMRPTEYTTRSAAHKAAVKLRPDPRDRLVLQCTCCPVTARSKRPAAHWRPKTTLGALADRVAARLGADVADVRRALAESAESPRA